jgi:hypothetical protein
VRSLDIMSTVVAAILGGFILWGLVYMFGTALFPTDSESEPNWGVIFAAGAVLGAGVQTGVRVTGVS